MEDDPNHRYQRRLPHLRITGSTYFVTWRLLHAQEVLCAEERTLVRDAIFHFVGVRYDSVGGVIMDDHVHVIVTPYAGFALESILHTWKSYTSNRMQRQFARVGAVWQDESWDRVIRNDAELGEKLAYIRGNPWKRWPAIEEYQWLWP